MKLHYWYILGILTFSQKSPPLLPEKEKNFLPSYLPSSVLCACQEHGSFVSDTEVAEAFSLDPDDFLARYGFEKPSKDVGERLVITCRSGRRVGLALADLDKLGYAGLR